ncbi:hypothetical protein [Pseudorhodoferax sp.]|nr:hypothetical protein [Pseudorhodoferax sp.]
MPKANVGPIRIPDVLQDEQVLLPSDMLPSVARSHHHARAAVG